MKEMVCILPDKNQRKAQQWFDAECYEKRRDTLKALHKVRSLDSQENLHAYEEKRRRYKKRNAPTRRWKEVKWLKLRS
jgi:hypothetical protein